MKDYEREICQEAADLAVKKIFGMLGVDVEKPREVEEFREDLRFGRWLRKAADRGVIVFIGVLATGVAAALWAGIVSKFGGFK